LGLQFKFERRLTRPPCSKHLKLPGSTNSRVTSLLTK
jgi:hypothetical protein